MVVTASQLVAGASQLADGAGGSRLVVGASQFVSWYNILTSYLYLSVKAYIYTIYKSERTFFKKMKVVIYM